MDFIVNKIYRENRLVPTSRNIPGLPKEHPANNISRYSFKGEDFICVAVDSTGKRGVLVDTNGKDYLISVDDFNSTLDYKNTNLVSKKISRFVPRRCSVDSFKEGLETYNSSGAYRYKSWLTESAEDSMVELKENHLYQARVEGKVIKFIYLEHDEEVVTILDIKSEKVYDVVSLDLQKSGLKDLGEL